MRAQILGHNVKDCIRAREVAEAHFAFELSNDADHIMKSMKSYDPLLTSVIVGDEGGTPRLVLCGTIDEQRAFYAQSRAVGHIVEVELLTSVGSDWYGFVHGLVTGRDVATSQEGRTELVGLLPVSPDEDTIAGEVGLSWLTTIAKEGDAPGALAHERSASRKVHDAWLEMLRSGDAATAANLYAENASFAFRDPVNGKVSGVTGRAAIVEYYMQLFAELEIGSVDIVTRIVDRWYVFSELLVAVRTPSEGEWLTRLADICVVDRSDRIIVHLSSGTVPPSITD